MKLVQEEAWRQEQRRSRVQGGMQPLIWDLWGRGTRPAPLLA